MDRWWGFIAYIIGFWFYIGANIFTPRSLCVRKMNALAQKYEYGTTKMATCHNFGYPDEAGVDVLSIIRAHDLHEKFRELFRDRICG